MSYRITNVSNFIIIQSADDPIRNISDFITVYSMGNTMGLPPSGIHKDKHKLQCKERKNGKENERKTTVHTGI